MITLSVMKTQIPYSAIHIGYIILTVRKLIRDPLLIKNSIKNSTTDLKFLLNGLNGYLRLQNYAKPILSISMRYMFG